MLPKDIMNEVFLCLGGNLGNRSQILTKSAHLIEKECGKIIKKSKIYETVAWGSKSQKKFLNEVIQIKTKYSAEQLLTKLLAIEKSLGRKRNNIKNSDRLIDIDILFFNNEIIKNKSIEIPHPRLHLRNFVLKPLMDINKDLIHPALNKSIKKIYKNCGDTLAATEFTPVKYICIEGNIGSGKTTLAKELAKQINADFLPEQFEKNDLLQLFYSKPDAFAFPLEFNLLLNRYTQIKNSVKKNAKLIIGDYSIYKSLWFAKVNLGNKEFLFFKKHFKALELKLPKPDVIIYLQTSTSNLKQNVLSRGRQYEKNISVKYLNEVGKQYLKGIKEMNTSKKLLISIKKYDSGLNQELIKRIKDYLN